MRKQQTILIVDDDEALLEILAQRLRFEGFEVYTACDGAEGVACYCRQPTDVVISDIQMPVLNGLEMMRYIRALNPSVKTIYASGAVGQFCSRLKTEVREFGAVILDKPFTSETLLASLRAAPETRPEHHV